MATIPRILTYEEWLRMPPVQDGTDEVVKGKRRFMPPTLYPHAEIICHLLASLARQTDEDSIRILGSSLGLMISRDPLTCRTPDLIMFWRDKMVIHDGWYWSPPGLVVEIISSSEDVCRKEEKLEDYASIGVPEAWLVSPQAQSVEIRLLTSGKLKRTDILAEGNLEPIQFPGVSIPLVNLWPD